MRVVPPAVLHEPMGAQLKTVFDRLTASPMPDRMQELADALERAFQQGELQMKAKGLS